MLCDPVTFDVSSPPPSGYIQLFCVVFQSIQKLKINNNVSIFRVIFPSFAPAWHDLKKYGYFDRTDLIFLFLPFFIIFLRLRLMRLVKNYFLRNFPLIPRTVCQRISQNSIQVLVHVIFFSCSFYSIIILRPFYFYNPILCLKDWSPTEVIPTDIYLNYLIQLSCHLSGVYMILYVDMKRSDSNLLLFHHFVTISLISLSYLMRFYRMGVFVMFLHDLLDILLGGAKLCLYVGKYYYKLALSVLSDILFFSFAFLWFVFRLYWYPLKVLYATPIAFVAFDYIPFSFFPIFNGLLTFLQIIHLVWSLLIVNAILRRLWGAKSDFRENDGNNNKED